MTNATSAALRFVSNNLPPGRVRLKQYATYLTENNRLTNALQVACDNARVICENHDFVIYIAGTAGASEQVKARYASTSYTIAAYKKPGARLFGYAPHLYASRQISRPSLTVQERRDINYLFSIVIADGQLTFWDACDTETALQLGWAEAAQLPVVLILPQHIMPPRLVLGLNNNAGTVRYDQFTSDGLPHIQHFLGELELQLLGRS